MSEEEYTPFRFPRFRFSELRESFEDAALRRKFRDFPTATTPVLPFSKLTSDSKRFIESNMLNAWLAYNVMGIPFWSYSWEMLRDEDEYRAVVEIYTQAGYSGIAERYIIQRERYEEMKREKRSFLDRLFGRG
ncbi:hypothetical protein DRN87_02200 [Candidatus Geothermarchaeota archaeon]|nr:MAG: hypothetical protein DRN87_02200 [Candidatus Geothermarchaeota archaeon]